MNTSNLVKAIPENDLFLLALKGEAVKRPPVWMMRQAGRHLPEYIELRNKYSFFERCENPDLVAEITTQPIRRYGMDAAILFSDILVIPPALGQKVEMIESKGPVLPSPIRTPEDLLKLSTEFDMTEPLSYVYKGIAATLEKLENKVPLIGFSGSPWTLMCYMVEGKGSKDFSTVKAFCYQYPEAAKQLLDLLTKSVISYLKNQIKAGVHAVQVFDSWGGILSPDDFKQWSLPSLQQIVKEVKDISPVIVFSKGAWHALPDLAKTGANALGIDWCISPQDARKLAGSEITLQGNLDPAVLLAPKDVIRKETLKMIKQFGVQKYIANLGHGITPDVKPENAKVFFDTIKNYEA
jgi:uroporphyrinogen decarboxylase